MYLVDFIKCAQHLRVQRMEDNQMNKKAYEAPEMVLRMVSTDNIATMSNDDNVADDDPWEVGQ